MKWRTTGLVAAVTMVAPAMAEANCAARIAALEESRPMGGDGAGGGAGSGVVVREDGGQTTYQKGGPALPQDNWFTDAEEEGSSSALTHLDSARKAQQAGDEQGCLEAVGQAEAALRRD
jgi:hypothetical protein